jgi:hypothetical protein
MKTFSILIIVILISSCTKKIVVTSIDQIPGKWNWESTCGGVIDTCSYSSKSNYASVEFTSDGKYIEKHNDIVYMQSDYSIIKYDDTLGTLLLDNSNISRPIAVINNRLLISRGDSLDTYIKIK